MDRFCRGCLVRYEEPTEFLQYTEKNRRLFVYSTGLQVKRNDTFTFQLCKDCYLNMKVACKFKKQCRGSDKMFKSYTALKESGENTDLSTFLKNNDDSWAFRFPSSFGSSTPAYQRIKDDDNESTTTSIRNFMTDIMPDADLPDTEARIIKEVIEEEADLLDESLDSHWLQDDASIDTDFKLGFNFSPFSTPRSVNNDAYMPKELSEIDLTKQTYMNKENCDIVKDILDMPECKEKYVNKEDVNYDSVARRAIHYEEQIDSLDAVNDILKYQSEPVSRADDATQCSIDRKLREALKNSDTREFSLTELLGSPGALKASDIKDYSLTELLASPQAIPGIQSPPTPLINNILFGKTLDSAENSNSSPQYKTGQRIEKYENVRGDEIMDFENSFDISIKLEPLDKDEAQIKMEDKIEHLITDENVKKVPNMNDIFGDDITNFYCKMCNKKFKSLHGLKCHVKAHQKAKTCARVFICDHCGSETKHRTNFLRHIETHLQKRLTYKCKVCKQVFPSKQTLQTHSQTHSTEIGKEPKKRKEHVCPECGLTTNKKSNLDIHMRRHLKQYVCTCPECGIGFYRRAELTIHMRIHTGEKPFSCEHCNKSFARRDELTRHMKCHLELKPFKCDYCKTRFVTRANLKHHLINAKNCIKMRDLLSKKQEKADKDNPEKSYVVENTVKIVKSSEYTAEDKEENEDIPPSIQDLPIL